MSPADPDFWSAAPLVPKRHRTFIFNAVGIAAAEKWGAAVRDARIGQL
jgi:hypothetical protein